MRRSLVTLVSLIALVTLAACGSSSKSSEGATNTTKPPAATSTTMGDMHMDQGGDCATKTAARDGDDAEATLTAMKTHGGEGNDVKVTLTEWSVDPEAGALPAGQMLHLSVINTGAEKHELKLIKGAQKSLPTKADGSVDESQLAAGALAGTVIVPKGKTCELDVTLVAGTYTMVCNLVEDMGGGQMHVHYAKGMATEISAFGG